MDTSRFRTGICAFFNFLGSSFGCDSLGVGACEAKLDELKQVKKQHEEIITVQQKHIDGMGESLASLQSKNELLTDKIAALQEKLVKGGQQVHPQQKHWDDKYPRANITHSRYFMIGKTKIGFTDIDIRIFITPQDFKIRDDLKKAGLKAEDPLKVNKIVPKIYALAKKNYAYRHDREQFGFGEVWLFPFELDALRKTNRSSDCEDWAHKIASYLIAAGVPSWRVRVVCGTVNAGTFGHSTVYVLDDSLETWRHLNSTTPHKKYSDLSQYPHSSDSTDKIGIGDVWFSFSTHAAWHKFETSVARDSFKKILDKIKIRRAR